MSIQAISYVFQRSRARGAMRLVLLSLANHANTEGICWPAVQTIAAEAQVWERSVIRVLRQLEQQGEIRPVKEHSRGGRRPTVYELTGFNQWSADDVGPPTTETHAFSLAKSRQSLRKPQDRGPQEANTLTYGQGSPDVRSGEPRRTVRAALTAAPGQPRHTVRVSGTSCQGSPDRVSEIPRPTVTRTVSEPSVNRGPCDPQQPARPKSARTAARKGEKNHDRPPDTAWREGLDQPADPATLQDIAQHMKAVIEGKAMPSMVGPDYKPEDSDESEK